MTYPGAAGDLNVNQLYELVASVYNVTTHAIQWDTSREWPLPEARAMAAYLLAREIGRGELELGRARAASKLAAVSKLTRSCLSRHIGHIRETLSYNPQLQEKLHKLLALGVSRGLLAAGDVQNKWQEAGAFKETIRILYPGEMPLHEPGKYLRGTIADNRD